MTLDIINSTWGSPSKKRRTGFQDSSASKRIKINQETDIQSITQDIKASVSSALQSASKDKSLVNLLNSQLNNAKELKVLYLKNKGDTFASNKLFIGAKRYYTSALEIQKIYSNEMGFFQNILKCTPLNSQLKASILESIQRIPL